MTHLFRLRDGAYDSIHSPKAEESEQMIMDRYEEQALFDAMQAEWIEEDAQIAVDVATGNTLHHAHNPFDYIATDPTDGS